MPPIVGIHVTAVTVLFVEFTRDAGARPLPAWGRMPGMRRSEGSVARQVLGLQVLVVVVLVLVALGLAAYDARRDARTSARDRALAVALAVADSPAVRDGLEKPDPSATLQPYAEEVRTDTGVDFVVVMALDRTRYSHPDPAQLGQPFVGDLGGAPEGRNFTQEYAGTLGPSMRAVVPVTDGGKVVALVSVGITVNRIDDELAIALVPIAISAASVLAVGLAGAWLISRRLRRQTHGMGEAEITRMYEYYSAVLHAVREGLFLLDDQDRVQLVNDEARRLLDLPDDVVGRSIHDLGLPPGLVQAAIGDTAEADDIYLTDDHVLVVSASPATWAGREVGAVVTLRDHTDLQAVTGELDVVRGLTESLRSQNHEAANRLHTVVSLIEMGRTDEAVDFATEELQVAQLLTDRVVGAVDDPVLAALLLGKTAEAAERGIELVVTGEVTGPTPDVEPRDLVTVAGNLVDNALDAVVGRPERRVAVRIDGTDGRFDDHRRRQRPGPARRGPRAGPRARLVDEGGRHRWPRARPRPGRPGGAAPRRRGPHRHLAVRRRGVHGGARHRRPGAGVMTVRVLVVEDEATAAEAHAAYVGRVDGFEVAGIARSAADAVRHLNTDRHVDLILLDMHLPDGHGLGLLQKLRAAGPPLRRDRGDVGAGRRRGAARGGAGRRALPAQAVHLADVPHQARAVRRLPRPARRRRRRRRPGRRRPALRRAAAGRRRPAQGDERRVPAAGHHRAARLPRCSLRDRGGRGDRGVPGHRAALPRAPRGHRARRAGTPVRRQRASRGGVPLALGHVLSPGPSAPWPAP